MLALACQVLEQPAVGVVRWTAGDQDVDFVFEAGDLCVHDERIVARDFDDWLDRRHAD